MHKFLRKAPIFIGFGAGAYRFFGEDVGLWRFAIEPRVSIALPLKDTLYVELRYTLKYFYGGFSTDDFGGPMDGFNTDGGDAIQTLSLTVGF